MNKKTELTKIQCELLAIAQWGIKELLPMEYKRRDVYFTQVTLTEESLDRLENKFVLDKANEFKAFKLKAYFTTLQERVLNADDRGKSNGPYVKAEIVFKTINGKCDVRLAKAFIVQVINYSDISKPGILKYEPTESLSDQDKQFVMFMARFLFYSTRGAMTPFEG